MTYLYLTFLIVTASCTIGNPEEDGIYLRTNFRRHFEDFNMKYGRKHGSAKEENVRYQNFARTLERINERNSMNDSVRFGVTKFADWSEDEFRDYVQSPRRYQNPTNYMDVPEWKFCERDNNFDWREQNVVTEVRDQDLCHASYAFSAVGAIEAQYALKMQKDKNDTNIKAKQLSVQQIIDCRLTSNQDFCPEAAIEVAFKVVNRTGGLRLEEQYPFIGDHAIKQDCQVKFALEKVGVTSWEFVRPKCEELLRRALVTRGPVAIAMNVHGIASYKEGIWDSEDCNIDSSTNNNALLVGYGIEQFKPYWIIKFSWGSDWGEDGYLRLVRGKGMCNIDSHAVVPTIS